MARALKTAVFVTALVVLSFEAAALAAPVFLDFGWQAGVVVVAVGIGALVALFDAILSW